MRNAIKAYLERESTTDKALKEAYSEKKLDGCMNYIMKQARKKLSGCNGAIADATVYGWARHFILDRDTEPAEEESVENERFDGVHGCKKCGTYLSRIAPDGLCEKCSVKNEPKFKPVPGQLDLFGGMA